MKTEFTYSILQYRHSLALGEALNVGVLFVFPETQKIEFVYGNASRVKSVYPNFDTAYFNALLKSIKGRILSRTSELFYLNNLRNGLGEFIHSQVLLQDSTTLQFQEPVSVIDIFDSPEQVIRDFSKLLIPAISVVPVNTKQNEEKIISKVTKLISSKRPELDKKIEKSPVLIVSDLSVKFDLAYQNGSLNYIKAINFDLRDKGKIENKAFANYGSLVALTDYATHRNIKFNLIVSEPKDEELFVPYKNAISLIKSIHANQEIIPANKLDSYSDRIIAEIDSHAD